MSEQALRSMVQKYRYSEMVKRDISTVMQQYPDLQPALENYVFADGQSKDLVRLKGTIPVMYKGNTYNIPVIIWLMDTYPQNSPMCFVTPTATMQIKPSRYVDANGRIYLPYLHEWKNPESDLQGLVSILCIVFSEESPVFSRAAQPPARPPYPVSQSNQNSPYNPSGGGYGMPMPQPPSSYSSSTPPYQPYPVSGSNTVSPPTPYPATTSSSPITTGEKYGKQDSLSDDQIRASLLSAVEDKMRRRLREIFHQASAEMSALRKTQEDLSEGKTRLEEIIRQLDVELIEAEKNVCLLREKNEEIEKVVSEMEKSDEEPIDIDEAIITTAPLYKQLLNLFAEENAIEDAVYYLGEGLRKDVISLDLFLKHVRELSRKQFMLRATIQKCRIKAGLTV